MNRKKIALIIMISLIAASSLTLTILNSSKVRRMVISSDKDFKKYSSSGSGTEEDPYIIENRRFHCLKDKKLSVIQICNTTKHFTIQNCEIVGGESNLEITGIAKNTAKIIGNRFSTYKYCSYFIDYVCHNAQNSIVLREIEGIQIVNNQFFGRYNERGDFATIYVENCKNVNFANNKLQEIENIEFKNCRSIQVMDNVVTEETYSFGGPRYSFIDCAEMNIENNSFVITLFVGIIIRDCHNYTINNNTFLGNEFEDNLGIYLQYDYEEKDANAEISNNTFLSLGYGILIHEYTSILSIHNNTIKQCLKALVCSSSTSNISIYHNNFLDNDIFINSQAKDDGYNNSWYSMALLEGNYWSDWIGAGNYSIDGTANAYDLYPLNNPK